MCLMALASEAQVITSASVKKVYEEVSADASNGFVYNAEYDDNGCIIAQNVYRNVPRGKGDLNLIPILRYHYAYHADGTLASRTKFEWRGGEWRCYGKLDYTLNDGRYTVEYSRWNQKTASFDAANEMMTYTLLPDSSTSNVCFYQRSLNGDSYKLSWQVSVTGQPSFDPYLLAKM